MLPHRLEPYVVVTLTTETQREGTAGHLFSSLYLDNSSTSMFLFAKCEDRRGMKPIDNVRSFVMGVCSLLLNSMT